jgi:hypothetical protein
MRSSHRFDRFPLLFKSHSFASLRKAQSRLPFLNHKDSALGSLQFGQYLHSHPLGDERGSWGLNGVAACLDVRFEKIICFRHSR